MEMCAYSLLGFSAISFAIAVSESIPFRSKEKICFINRYFTIGVMLIMN